MTEANNIQWKRLSTEAAAIIASILLAFAIDAWWEERVDRDTLESQLRSLANEFDQNHQVLKRYIDLHEASVDGTESLITHLHAVEHNTPATVPAELIALSIRMPTFDPSSGSYDALLTSGHLAKIRNHELQSALAAWRGHVADATEDEINAINLIENRLLPYLNPIVPMAPMFDYRIGPGFEGPQPNSVSLDRTTQLENLLGRRRQHGVLAAAALNRLLNLLEQIQRLLVEELAS